MPRSPEAVALETVRVALEDVLGSPWTVAAFGEVVARGIRVDLLLRAPRATFVVEWKAAGDTANVSGAVQQLFALRAGAGRRLKSAVPVVAVPFMGETGRRLCTEAGVSWIDLSGNAWIDAPGYHVRVLGNPNRFASRGRPASAFAPKSSRVVRALLMHPDHAFSQATLVSLSGVDKGRVSRLLPRLQAMGIVEQLSDRKIRITCGLTRLAAMDGTRCAARAAYRFTRP
jgi:hypothetical protein